MFDRGISEVEIRDVIEKGEVIEDYPDDLPYRAQLILGRTVGIPLHIVASFDDDSRTIFVATVYEPSAKRWENGFRRRKRSRTARFANTAKWCPVPPP